MKKYIYFFRGDLRSHVNLYKGWVDSVSDDIHMTMLTIIDRETYLTQKSLVDKYRDEGVIIRVCNKKLINIFKLIQFSFYAIRYEQVIVHLRKQSTTPFNVLKKVFGKRIKYINELEGDFNAELEYLAKKENEYKPGFYTEIIDSMKLSDARLKSELIQSDKTIVATEAMKLLYINRYPEIRNLEDKLEVLPTATDQSYFYNDNNLRQKIRKSLGVTGKEVFIFCGNVHYSWQNISRTLKMFKLISEISSNDCFIILLIRKADHSIALDFIQRVGIKKAQYLLASVDYKEVNAYLNAADFGVLLRENDVLNRIVTTGKMGEYLCSGLNVITTDYIGFYSKKIKNEGYGIILKDPFCDDEIIEQYRKYSSKPKEEIANWAANNLSVGVYSDRYKELLKRV